ncbi:hypothetical protein GCM10011531_00790 [Aquaticitalea lipolytica]|uniref:Uncharacterized protein n=1 Tax=Aquaticitalea lipolytica TaxID=1247562 RepID=A0A8J2TLB2_9FLAO|nr:hypothetical protein [Aquaticitalea lipolytica]GFZ76015.1 hypothetical protein GCM10011531_00790 [Aquaticitalea lipolytica]
MFGSPIKYSDFFNASVPANPINLIKSIPKGELIASIAAVNTRLKPIFNTSFDNSKENQIDALRAILLDLENPIKSGIAAPYIGQYSEMPENEVLFTRVTCLYAYQEILATSGFVATRPPQYTPKQRVDLFKYLLICNERILFFDRSYSGNAHKILGKRFFEYFMFKELPHNQYYFIPHPLNRFYIGWYLMDKLITDSFFSNHFKDYLSITFGLDDITEFFKYIIGQFFGSNDDKLKVTYLKIKVKNTQAIQVLTELSKRYGIPLPAHTDLNVLDFLELKKSPVYDGGVKNGIHTFIIMDSILFLEKIYSLFINDFWFDYLKPQVICNRKDWGNFIGDKFFEPFINEIFKNISTSNKRVNYLNQDYLTFDINGKGHVEYADFYYRYKNKVLLIEAKSNYLPLINGFKTVNTIADFNKINVNQFYKDFGLLQLVEKTLFKFNEYKTFIKDPEFRKKGKLKIYPLLLLNEPIISLGPSNLAFRKKFDEMLSAKGIDKEFKSIRIMPLSILNISEFQDIEQSIIDRDQCLFNLFQMHFSATDFTKIKTTHEAATPLSIIINKHIPHHKKISKDVRKFKWLGFNKNK